MLHLFRRLCQQRATRRPSLEIHIPISPTEDFFTKVRCFAASLRLNGGPMADSPIVVTVGADQEPVDLYRLQPWSRQFPITWHWLDRELYRRKIFFATALERFRYPFRANCVLMADADILVTGDLTDLVRLVVRDRVFAGLIAHVSPFRGSAPCPLHALPHFAELTPLESAVGERRLSCTESWSRLFAAAGLEAPPARYEHSGWGILCRDPAARACPPYFNFGVLIAPADLMKAVGQVIYEEMDHVDRVVETCFKCQLALSLALVRLGLPTRALPLRYNFPNDPLFEGPYADELREVRLLHYLRKEVFDKDRDFRGLATLGAALQREVAPGINAVLQQYLRKVDSYLLASRDPELARVGRRP